MTVAYVFGRWDAASPAYAAAPDIPSDEVFRRIANGDRLAMRTLFARYRVSLYRWLLRSVAAPRLFADQRSADGAPRRHEDLPPRLAASTQGPRWRDLFETRLQ